MTLSYCLLSIFKLFNNNKGPLWTHHPEGDAEVIKSTAKVVFSTPVITMGKITQQEVKQFDVKQWVKCLFFLNAQPFDRFIPAL